MAKSCVYRIRWCILSEAEINYILYSEMLPCFHVAVLKPGRKIVKKDPSDNKFIHCAITGKAGVIISGDQHLLNIKTYQKIKILTQAQFLANL